MPTRQHEIWLELIQERPALVAELLGWVYPGELPAFARADLESGDLTEHRPTEYRADAVVTLGSKERRSMGCSRCCLRRPVTSWRR